MASRAHPQAMAPRRPGRTRTAPPQTAPGWYAQPRMRRYLLFGACSIAFVLSSLLLLRWVWALGSGPSEWRSVQQGLKSPIYVLYHVVAVLAFVYTGFRFFIQLFAKSQPPRIGPIKPPPAAAFPPLLVGAWLAVSAAVFVVAWGIFP
jgi:fumarate reductase subunit C